jgi:hypothetical protein
MKHSDSIIELAKALALFHIKVGKIKKDAKNPFFKSNYASLSNILTEVQDPLNESGLVITQFPDEMGLVSMLIHAESGQYISSNYQMPVSKPNDPQALGSSITYARRYAISSILSLNVEDDDGNKGAEKPKPTKEQFNGLLAYLKGTDKQKEQANSAIKSYALTAEQTKEISKL